MREMILKLLEMVHPEIKELMLKVNSDGYEYWQLLDSCVLSIIEMDKLWKLKDK